MLLASLDLHPRSEGSRRRRPASARPLQFERQSRQDRRQVEQPGALLALRAEHSRLAFRGFAGRCQPEDRRCLPFEGRGPACLRRLSTRVDRHRQCIHQLSDHPRVLRIGLCDKLAAGRRRPHREQSERGEPCRNASGRDSGERRPGVASERAIRLRPALGHVLERHESHLPSADGRVLEIGLRREPGQPARRKGPGGVGSHSLPGRARGRVAAHRAPLDARARSRVVRAHRRASGVEGGALRGRCGSQRRLVRSERQACAVPGVR